jgi:hypothetical protein
VFEVDKEGTLAEWEGVVLLDFVDEHRLVAAHDSVAYGDTVCWIRYFFKKFSTTNVRFFLLHVKWR